MTEHEPTTPDAPPARRSPDTNRVIETIVLSAAVIIVVVVAAVVLAVRHVDQTIEDNASEPWVQSQSLPEDGESYGPDETGVGQGVEFEGLVIAPGWKVVDAERGQPDTDVWRRLADLFVTVTADSMIVNTVEVDFYDAANNHIGAGACFGPGQSSTRPRLSCESFELDGEPDTVTVSAEVRWA